MTQENSSFESRLLTAKERFIAGQFDEAVALVDEVATTHPNRAQVLLECVRSFGYCFEIQRAEDLLEAILSAVAIESRPAVGLVFQQIFRPDRAVSVLEELKCKNKLSLPNVAQLAKLYEQSNRQDEAIEALTECVKHAPSQPQPKVLLARLRRQAGQLDEAERLLQTVVASSAPTAALVHAWSEWTLVRDQQGDYRQAIVAIENAKSLLREMPRVQQQAKRSVAINVAFQQLYAQLEPTTVKSWGDEPLESPDPISVAHLVGFPRSGTTLLEQMLDAHPEIHSASERAVFTRAIFPEMCRNGGLSIDAMENCTRDQLNDLRSRYIRWHEEIAGECLNGQLLLDKNPNHTSLLVGLFRLFPESRIVFALRDPRDVIVSTYMRFFSLSEFSASYLTWQSTCELYAHEMNVWLKMRSLLADNWIEVKYENTVDDPESTTKSVSELLGIPWNPAMSNYRDNTRKFVHSPTHAEVRKPVYSSSVGRWRNYEQYLAPQLDKLEPFIGAFGYK